jgi:glycogen operon protein
MTAPAERVTAVLPGRAFPLGHHPREGGANFEVESGSAEGVELCRFDSAGQDACVGLPESDAGVWHRFVPGVTAGQAYGYRSTGPYDPARGVRCNPDPVSRRS